MMTRLAAGAVLVCVSLLIPVVSSARVLAIDSSDLLFHLAFEEGVTPDLARGCGKPAMVPEELSRRLVEGAVGRGYLFAGNKSTIEYYSGANGPRGCEEMYGLKSNLLGDAGTLCYWIKHLEKDNSQNHDFVRFGSCGAYRDQWGVYYFTYAQKQGQMYNTFPPRGVWMHFAASWRKDEMRTYLNGKPWGVVSGCGVLDKTPERFIIAAQGSITAEFQKKEVFDDAVIDEVQIFGRPLTDDEIRSVYERAGVVGKRLSGNNFSSYVSDELGRVHANAVLTAPAITSPIHADGELAEWKAIPGHGCFIERRLGVLDSDPSRIYAASDAQNLYLGFRCPVDDSIQNDPTHIKYPTGEFKASPRERDGGVYEDDYVEFILKGTDGHEYRFAINARGSLVDSRDGDKSFNGDVKWAARSDLKDWTAELAIPLSLLAARPGDTVDFNVIRSWKLFRSSQNSLCTDAACQPAPGKLKIGAPAAAAVETLGTPSNGRIAAAGKIVGPPGDYTVRLRGKGVGINFSEEKKVAAGSFAIEKNLDKPGDMALIVEVSDPSGRNILTRTIPLVFVAASSVELSIFPGWVRIEAKLTPVRAEGASAVVSITQNGKTLLKSKIARFTDPSATAQLVTSELKPGSYEVLTQLYRGNAMEGEDRQPYVKKPLPAWYHSQAGVIDGPPIPWTDVRVEGHSIKLLIKDITFNSTLFPAQIVSNGQHLLSGPIRVRVKRGGIEKTITAGSFKFTSHTRRRADWTAVAQDGPLKITVKGWTEFDGFTWMNVTLSGGHIDHMAVDIPLSKECATLKTLGGKGLTGDKQLQTNECGDWFGNEKAGLQYWWEDKRGWVTNGEKVTITPSASEVVISIPFIQKPTELAKPRTVTFGWAITPSKPIRGDWRSIKLHKAVTYTTSYYTNARPNYPSLLPGETYEGIEKSLAALKKLQKVDIVLWYAFGPFMWVGAPEYADWWREWRVTSWQTVPPNPNSTEWGWACHASSGSDLFLWMLQDYMKKYPQRGVYVDCYFLMGCDNEAHGCGYVDENGKRQMTSPLLATRRHYERLYNIIKAADPTYGWLRIHDWGPIMPVAAFADENWSGEGLIGPIGNTPEKNYYRVVDLPYARMEFRNEQWGHFQNWLTELGVYAGTDPKKREEWFGKMLSPPNRGKHGQWVLPRMADYDHAAGLALIHDMWNFGGNDCGISSQKLTKMMNQMGWDDAVRFYGYWELGDKLSVDGGVPEKIVCSLYFRPADKDPQGKPTKPWLLLAAMNNTDEDAKITLRPNLNQFGLDGLANGRLRDAYAATGYVLAGTTVLNPGDPEPPYIVIDPVQELFPMKSGAAEVPIPKRHFRALLLEGSE